MGLLSPQETVSNAFAVSFLNEEFMINGMRECCGRSLAFDYHYPGRIAGGQFNISRFSFSFINSFSIYGLWGIEDELVSACETGGQLVRTLANRRYLK